MRPVFSFLPTVRNFSRLLIFTFDSGRLRVGLFNYTTINFIKSEDNLHSEVSQLTISLRSESVQFEEHSDSSWRREIGTGSSSNRVTVFRDPFWDGAAIVSIPLQGYIANELSMELFHSRDWLLISEVQFISGKIIS